MGSCCSRRIKKLATRYLPKDEQPSSVKEEPIREELNSEHVEEFSELEGVHTE